MQYTPQLVGIQIRCADGIALFLAGEAAGNFAGAAQILDFREGLPRPGSGGGVLQPKMRDQRQR
jgi:hypothetical protein